MQLSQQDQSGSEITISPEMAAESARFVSNLHGADSTYQSSVLSALQNSDYHMNCGATIGQKDVTSNVSNSNSQEYGTWWGSRGRGNEN